MQAPLLTWVPRRSLPVSFTDFTEKLVHLFRKPVLGHDIADAKAAIEQGDLASADRIFGKILSETSSDSKALKAEMAYEIGTLYFTLLEWFVAFPLKYKNADPLGCATRAVAYLRDSLSCTERDVHPEAWRIVSCALGRALVRLGSINGDEANLIEAIPLLQRSLLRSDAIQSLSPRMWFSASKDLWTTWIDLARKVSDDERRREHFHSAEKYLRLILSQGPPRRASSLSILLKSDLGQCLFEWGRFERDAKKLEESISFLREALEENEDSEETQWGNDKFIAALAASLQEFGYLQKPWSEPHLREAANLYKKLLATPWVAFLMHNPIRLAAVQNNVGDLLSNIAALNDDYVMLNEAETYLREASRVLLPYGASRDRGAVEANLGLLLLRK